MTRTQRTQLGLWGIAALLCMALVAVIVSAFRPLSGEVLSDGDETVPTAAGDLSSGIDAQNMLPPLDTFAAIWSRDLRRPLYDPPPPPPRPAPRPQPKAKPTITLVGIVSEPGHSRAMLALNGGKTEMKGIGDTVDDRSGPVEIIEITADDVLVVYLGEQYRLTLPREAQP